MGGKARSVILKLIAGFSIIAGGFVGFWMLTIGLFITLFSYETNKDASVFLIIVIGLLFSILLVKGGIGIKKHTPSARPILIVSYALAIIPAIAYIIEQLIYGFSSDGLGSEYFDTGAWVGGLIFWSFMVVLLFSIVVFLRRNRLQ